MRKLCDSCGIEDEGEEYYEEPLNKDVFWCNKCINGIKKYGYYFKPERHKK